MIAARIQPDQLRGIIQHMGHHSVEALQRRQLVVANANRAGVEAPPGPAPWPCRSKSIKVFDNVNVRFEGRMTWMP